MKPASYAPLSAECPEWGVVAVLPSDTETFGFAVGDWRPGDNRSLARSREPLRAAIQGWAQRHGVELVSARVAADDAEGRLVLDLLEFAFVHCNIEAEIPDLQRVAPPSARHPIRPAEPSDHSELIRIAEQSFRLDRYHADARFPLGLPELRHRRWMEELLGDSTSRILNYTTGERGRPLGLFSVKPSGDDAWEIQLAAVDPSRQGSGIGSSLFAGSLHALKSQGARRCIGKFYAANIPVMNVFARAGFRFSAAQALYHWHAPAAPHLRPLEDVFGR
jgi:GNAT superfamily N-acetyltransferase